LFYAQSGCRYFDLLQTQGDSVKVTVTTENIENQLIMSQQSLTQFFKSTSNKWKLEGPEGDHEITVAKKNAKYEKVKRNFPG
jgi:hypothetical protein